MRFRIKYNLSAIAHGIVLAAVVGYIAQLAHAGRLGLYIHPRYFSFTIAMTAIAALMVVVFVLSQHHIHDKKRSAAYTYAPLCIVMGAVLFLPARSLTSATISQRSVDGVSTAQARSINTLFAGSSKSLKLADWVQLLSTHADEGYYANKPAKISGFVYDADMGGDVVWVSRFAVTCCAVDAQPMGVPVQIEGWRDRYSQDTWVEVEGVFKKTETTKGSQLVLHPTRLQEIEEPTNPYAN